MYLLYMYETFTEPTRINLPPEQTQTKPQVSLGLLLENLPQLRVNFGSTRGFTLGLLWVCFWGPHYALKCETDLFCILLWVILVHGIFQLL